MQNTLNSSYLSQAMKKIILEDMENFGRKLEQLTACSFIHNNENMSFYSLRKFDFPTYVIQGVSEIGENILDAFTMDQTKKILHTDASCDGSFLRYDHLKN
jgi:hypothetical protein